MSHFTIENNPDLIDTEWSMNVAQHISDSFLIADEFSTLRSVRSQLTDCASLQHNYSNISPVAASGAASQLSILTRASREREPEHDLTSGHHGPASLVSSITASSASVTMEAAPAPGPRTPPSERQRRRERSVAEEMRRSRLAEISDLTRLQGPLTEDAVVKTLQARFYNQNYQVGSKFTWIERNKASP